MPVSTLGLCWEAATGRLLGTSPNAIGSKGLQARGQALPLNTGYRSNCQVVLKGL